MEDEGWNMKHEGWRLKGVLRMDEQMDICDCRVAFATEIKFDQFQIWNEWVYPSNWFYWRVSWTNSALLYLDKPFFTRYVLTNFIFNSQKERITETSLTWIRPGFYWQNLDIRMILWFFLQNHEDDLDHASKKPPLLCPGEVIHNNLSCPSHTCLQCLCF